MSVETLGGVSCVLLSGIRVTRTLVRVDGVLYENRVMVYSGNVMKAVLFPIVDDDLPAIRKLYPEADV